MPTTNAVPSALEEFFDVLADNNTVSQQKDGHTNNWAVLVCASRYWFNYRVRAGV
jgi:phosphatidylinositol glycan class K